jgi:hypothetical protein
MRTGRSLPWRTHALTVCGETQSDLATSVNVSN